MTIGPPADVPAPTVLGVGIDPLRCGPSFPDLADFEGHERERLSKESPREFEADPESFVAGCRVVDTELINRWGQSVRAVVMACPQDVQTLASRIRLRVLCR